MQIKKLLLLIPLLLLLSNPVLAASCSEDANAETCWNIELGSGTKLDDQSSNSRDGTFKGVGEPAWDSADVPGAINEFNGTSVYSVDFDGSDDVITTTYSGVLGTSARTVVFWFKTASSGVQHIIGWGLSSSGTGNIYRISIEDGDIWARVGNGASEWVGTWADGAWHHLALVMNDGDDVGDLLLYIDGSLESIDTAGSTVIDTTDDVDVRIGENAASGSDSYFSGNLDETAIYSDAKDSTYLIDVMKNGLVQEAATSESIFGKGIWGIME